MHRYGRENLAMVNIFIQSPYVTKIRRDVAMTWTNYVANTGGLLGLCIGKSNYYLKILPLDGACLQVD